MKADSSFSIIIPHKDNPKLLQRCLDSIPNRDDVEVIVVDDNSNPDLVDFSDFPGTKSNNISVEFIKENKGAGHARNVGLDSSNGEWVIFADADDFFEPDAFEHFERYKKSDGDIIYFGVNSKISDSLEPADRADYFQNLLYGYQKGDPESEDWLRLRYLVPWGKMIRRSLIEDYSLRFEEVLASNDIMFSVKVGNLAKDIAVDYSQVYCVTLAKGSLTNTRSREIARTRYEVKLRFNDYVRSIGKEKYQYTVRRELFESMKYGWKEFLIYWRLARKHKTDLFFALNIGRAIKSMNTYKKEERKKGKFIIKK